MSSLVKLLRKDRGLGRKELPPDIAPRWDALSAINRSQMRSGYLSAHERALEICYQELLHLTTQTKVSAQLSWYQAERT